MLAFVLGAALVAPAAMAAPLQRIDLASVTSDGARTGNNRSFEPSVTADGRHVAFWSLASDLVEGDQNNNGDVFVRDRETETTEIVSLTTRGTQSAGTSLGAQITPLASVLPSPVFAQGSSLADAQAGPTVQPAAVRAYGQPPVDGPVLNLSLPPELRSATSATLMTPVPRGSNVWNGAPAVDAAAAEGASTVRWTRRIEGVVPGPSPRFAAAVAYDERRAELLVFGGGFFADNKLTFSGDTWTQDDQGNWRSRTTPVAPPPRGAAAVAYDAARERTVLFGGLGQDAIPLGDTWMWDGAAWTQIPTPTSPSPRAGAAIAYDATSQRVVLFGGYDAAGQLLADTWSFDGAQWLRVDAGTGPSPRSGAAMTYVDQNDGLLLFGGYEMNDTWLLRDGRWTQLTLLTSPDPSAEIALEYHRTRNVAVLWRFSAFGGETETWTWNGNEWARSTAQIAPGTRSGAAVVYDSHDDAVVMFGGSQCALLQEQWAWDGYWRQKHPPGAFPLMRTYNNGVAFDRQRDRGILFSGSHCGELFDTWTWDGDSWTAVEYSSAESVPPARTWGNLAFDAARDEAVLFGGRTCPSFDCASGDTWTFDASTAKWTERDPLRSPPPREGAAMAFDHASEEIVLFSGIGPGVSLNGIGIGIGAGGPALADTWTWDGQTWTQENPATQPPSRVYGAAAVDRSGRPVLFGGIVDPYDVTALNVDCLVFYDCLLNDTWRWNGVTRNWDRVAIDGPVPPARWGATMAYDGASGEIVLFGGEGGGQRFEDVWSFDGTRWRQRGAAQENPSPRMFAAMSEGSRSNPPTLFGGGFYLATDPSLWVFEEPVTN